MALRTAILGVGLIGGSIGLALRRDGWPVTGWGPREGSLKEALRCGAIERIAASVQDAVEDAELVIAAGPIRSLPAVFRSIARAARAGTVVTDVGSVKGQVLRWAAELLPDRLHFVGGHPMAGKEVQGVGAADANLLCGCTYCLVPGSDRGLTIVRQLVAAVGARPLIVSADDHDRAVAAASHLPFLIATALIKTVAPELEDLTGMVAASGFRDTTRVAMASPAMHADICNFNSLALREVISRFESALGELRSQLDEAAIEQAFEQAARARQAWGRTRAGANRQTDLFVVP